MSIITSDSTIMRSSEQVSTNLGDEIVILGLASDEYYSLKNVGVQIWDIIEHATTVKEVRDAILARYDVKPERCEHDLMRILERLVDEGLVQVQPADARPKSG